MCGICGLVATGRKPVLKTTLKAMNDALYHRGPDDEGYFIQAESVGLAMRRLSIIDVAGGQQPIHNEDESVWVVFNGEIYNHEALRRRLRDFGHRFATASDTEVIVHLYEEYGLDLVDHLRGMFVFALYDLNEGLLVVARDRSGQKPLYYSQSPNFLAFASEIKALRQSGLIENQLNLTALDSYLGHGFVPGAETLFAGVRKLPAGSMLLFNGGKVEQRRYWDLPCRTDRAIGEAEATLELRRLLEEAVDIRLMSEVPLGAFLSGGLDSSAVVGLMSQRLSRPVQTFSIGFDDRRLDELSYAKQVAAHFGSDHHEEVVTACPPDLLHKVNWLHDEPAADPAVVPTYLLSKFARQVITVALTGEGGDEIFGGYHHYKVYRQLLTLERRIRGFGGLARGLSGLLPVANRRLRKGLWIAGLPPEERPRGWLTTFPDEEKAALCRREFRQAVNGRVREDSYAFFMERADALDDLTRSMYVDSKLQLADQLLMKVDKTTMATSLEARCPLLDHKLVEFVAALPIEMKISQAGSKLIFKKAVADVVPLNIIERPKQGFEVPIDKWLRGDLRNCVEDTLLQPRAALFDYLDHAFVNKLWTDFLRRPDRLLARQLWLLLNLGVWIEVNAVGSEKSLCMA